MHVRDEQNVRREMYPTSLVSNLSKIKRYADITSDRYTLIVGLFVWGFTPYQL